MSKSSAELLAEAISLIPESDALRQKVLELAPCRLSEAELDAIVNFIANRNQGIMSSLELALAQLLGDARIRQPIIHEKRTSLKSQSVG